MADDVVADAVADHDSMPSDYSVTYSEERVRQEERDEQERLQQQERDEHVMAAFRVSWIKFNQRKGIALYPGELYEYRGTRRPRFGNCWHCLKGGFMGERCTGDGQQKCKGHFVPIKSSGNLLNPHIVNLFSGYEMQPGKDLDEDVNTDGIELETSRQGRGYEYFKVSVLQPRGISTNDFFKSFPYAPPSHLV